MDDIRAALKKFQNASQIQFDSEDILLQGLTHKSYAIEKNSSHFNERLEFLGDSILSAIVAEFLYTRYPSLDEGKLSRMKSYLVSRTSLARWAVKLKLGSYVLLSQGEDSSGGRKRDSLLSNVFEAVVGAIYIDQGYETARRFIMRDLSKIQRIADIDYKSKLQEIVQQRLKLIPDYIVVQETGPDHNKQFKIEVQVKKKRLGTGIGKSKKEAEQSAARAALKVIKTRLDKSLSVTNT